MLNWGSTVLNIYRLPIGVVQKSSFVIKEPSSPVILKLCKVMASKTILLGKLVVFFIFEKSTKVSGGMYSTYWDIPIIWISRRQSVKNHKQAPKDLMAKAYLSSGVSPNESAKTILPLIENKN